MGRARGRLSLAFPKGRPTPASSTLGSATRRATWLVAALHAFVPRPRVVFFTVAQYTLHPRSCIQEHAMSFLLRMCCLPHFASRRPFLPWLGKSGCVGVTAWGHSLCAHKPRTRFCWLRGGCFWAGLGTWGPHAHSYHQPSLQPLFSRSIHATHSFSRFQSPTSALQTSLHTGRFASTCCGTTA